jgi:hypothetical protein
MRRLETKKKVSGMEPPKCLNYFLYTVSISLLSREFRRIKKRILVKQALFCF